jgi:hypothetical protein
MNEEGSFYIGTTVFDLRTGEQFAIPLEADNEPGSVTNQIFNNVFPYRAAYKLHMVKIDLYICKANLQKLFIIHLLSNELRARIPCGRRL